MIRTLLTKEVEISLNGNNVKYLENLGYEIPRRKNASGRMQYIQGTKIIVKVKDLNKNNVLVDVQCDNEECNKIIKDMKLNVYKTHVKEDGKYYCHKCAIKLYGKENTRKTKLKNGKSFKQWCIENDRQDVLDRWDYELNDCKPNKILSHTMKSFYFKCPRGLHESEFKNISAFTSKNSLIKCNKCNSFAQWGIDNLGGDFLEKYWDYEKNDELGINPWDISYGNSYDNIYIYCQEKDYHESYIIKCNSFTGQNHRCSYCVNQKIHLLDSLGTLYPEVLELWSDKNDKSPFEYAPFGSKWVWWKCPDGKHEDFYRDIGNSNKRDFRCPECQYSKGEERISNDFISKGFIKIDQKEFELLDDNYNKDYYIHQMKYDRLLGVGNGLLSYDFYIPKLNLLIEYQGEFHDGTAKNQTEEEFKIQQEHDKRKREYAQINNIILLEIWYWDFDRIEEILEKELNLIKI